MDSKERLKILEKIVANEKLLGVKKETEMLSMTSFDTYSLELPNANVILKKVTYDGEDAPSAKYEVTMSMNNLIYTGNENGVQTLKKNVKSQAEAENNARGFPARDFVRDGKYLLPQDHLVYDLLFLYIRKQISAAKDKAKEEPDNLYRRSSAAARTQLISRLHESELTQGDEPGPTNPTGVLPNLNRAYDQSKGNLMGQGSKAREEQADSFRKKAGPNLGESSYFRNLFSRKPNPYRRGKLNNQ
ncbi:MAG: hypothetical protein V1866_03420 [archaeon]